MDPISRTNASTPLSSPGLFSPAAALQQRHPKSQDATPSGSPLLHPLQMHRVRETHEANIEKDFITGRKLINQYEIIDEIGRGQHGKVKLARSLESGNFVAIKIIQRFSKKRRLGKVTMSPETKTKREIAILKKIRHPNVVGLLEVIDDPELKKIYMVLEHVAKGEIQWRKKGPHSICAFERRRIERDLRGEWDMGESEKHFRQQERRRLRHEAQRQKALEKQRKAEHWSNEHGNDDEDDGYPLSRQPTDDSMALSLVRSHTSYVRSNPGSRVPSTAPSANSSRAHTPLPIEADIGPLDSDNEDETPGPLPSYSRDNRSSVHESAYGSYQEEPAFRGRSPSMADSIISHMSSNDGYHDPFEDDFSYVPCFTFDQARSAFRDTVLGLEYLHYEGIVHRDIKPANLLWTSTGRVKISDFGVSYFGRPIRDGEPDENLSESDARDFDNDLELAKTVGTPAFFAPELCFTDLNIPQPKVSEQIDVWSLGVTLYCLIYARIPFLAEDEWQLFKAIAQEEVHIPRRRLKPVNNHAKFEDREGPEEDPSSYREEHDLEMEDVDDELYDLLRRMMLKDPAERIKLREVKRHPWTLRGITDVIGWLDDTDPSRAHSGRRIQVDDRELERAVVPITFLERARSAVKKAVGKVIGATRGDRTEGSRKRATSSVGSSSGEVSQVHTPLALTSPHGLNSRRPSLKGEDTYFPPPQHPWEQHHPLSQSVTVSPDETVNEDSFDENIAQFSFPTGLHRYPSSIDSEGSRPGLPERTVSAAASIQTVVHDRGHARSGSMTTPASTGILPNTETLGDSYFTSHDGGIVSGRRYSRTGSRGSLDDGLSRARSVDRVLFTSDDKHGAASVAISTAVAPGAFQRSRSSQESLISRSFDSSPSHLDHHAPFYTPYMIATYQNCQCLMPPAHIAGDHSYIATIPEERPSTATQTSVDPKTPAPRVYRASTPESFARAEKQLARRQQQEHDAEQRRREAKSSRAIETLSESECPPSPDDEIFISRESNLRQKSCSSINSSGILSPISPFDVASPTSSVDLDSSNGQPIASDQSLPQLVSTSTSSSASYISKPSFGHPSGSDHTPESLTPATLTKQSSRDEHTPTAMSLASSYLTDDDDGYVGDQDLAVVADDSDDSDEGLTMGGPRKGKKFMLGTGGVGRRGTNASVGSTETAKKVPMNG